MVPSSLTTKKRLAKRKAHVQSFAGPPFFNREVESSQAPEQVKHAALYSSKAKTANSLLTVQRDSGKFATHVQPLLGSLFLNQLAVPAHVPALR